MSDITILRARLRKRDRDIQQAVKRLNLEEGEMADMFRDGFRMRLTEMGALGTRDKPSGPITPEVARMIARELMREQKKKAPPSEG